MTWPAELAAMDAELVEYFGEPTTYTPAAGGPVSVTGIFDEAYVLVEAGAAGVQSTSPAVFYRFTDLPVDPDVDEPEIEIAGVTYAVREIKRSGPGVLLVLRRV